MIYDIAAREAEKMHSLDRVIVLQPMEGKTTLSSTGIADKRLFNGENKLHAIFDIRTGLWCLKYEQGNLPGSLDVRFSELDKLVDHVRAYFEKRNVEIVEIRD